MFGLKGHVQAYGDRSQLNLSGLDHNELFNDIKDSNKLPEDTVFQDEGKATGKVYWSVRKHLISVYSYVLTVILSSLYNLHHLCVL